MSESIVLFHFFYRSVKLHRLSLYKRDILPCAYIAWISLRDIVLLFIFRCLIKFPRTRTTLNHRIAGVTFENMQFSRDGERPTINRRSLSLVSAEPANPCPREQRAYSTSVQCAKLHRRDSRIRRLRPLALVLSTYAQVKKNTSYTTAKVSTQRVSTTRHVTRGQNFRHYGISADTGVNTR